MILATDRRRWQHIDHNCIRIAQSLEAAPWGRIPSPADGAPLLSATETASGL